MAVVIETTLGDLTVDLFVHQRPRTCLNFLKLCKLKYYNFSLFHTIQHGFIAQAGDPTGEGTGGSSVWGLLDGPARTYFQGENMPKLKHTQTGLLSMVASDNGMVGSQFFFTLNPDLNSLDSKHCIIGQVAEGHQVLRLMNETICDSDHRPYQDVRITHTVILEDPFDDPKNFREPSRSPSPSAERLAGGRIAPDEEIDDFKGKTEEEVAEMIQEREAKARATILEIVGDLPDAEMAPPENVLFVCKLNPVTTDDDLEIIFSRFGTINCCEVIRDKKSGDSLQYAFIEFENKKSCEDAYFKMDNVLIDDRRIHVDFSQSVSKIKWRGKGRGVIHIDDAQSEADNKPEQSKSHRNNDRDNRTRSDNFNNRHRNDTTGDRHGNYRDQRGYKNDDRRRMPDKPRHREQTDDRSRYHRNDGDRNNKIKSHNRSPERYRSRDQVRDRSPERTRNRSPDRSKGRIDNSDKRRDANRESYDRNKYRDSKSDSSHKKIPREDPLKERRMNRNDDVVVNRSTVKYSDKSSRINQDVQNGSKSSKELNDRSKERYDRSRHDVVVKKDVNPKKRKPDSDNSSESNTVDCDSAKKKKTAETKRDVKVLKKKDDERNTLKTSKSKVVKRKKRNSSSSSSSSSTDSSDESSDSSAKKKIVKRKVVKKKSSEVKRKSKKAESSSSSSESSSSVSYSSSSDSDSSDSGHERARKKSKNKKSVREKLIRKKNKK